LPKLLDFGRELFEMNTQFTAEHGESLSNTKMIRDAFSLLAYNDPYASPMGYQLDDTQRELINSVILEANNMPRILSLEVLCHSRPDDKFFKLGKTKSRSSKFLF
jgi:hypothetical protein